MALKIRLQKTGKRDDVSYRIVVVEEAAKRDGKITQLLGHYKPGKTPSALTLDRELTEKWISKGAKPTEAVRKIISK